MRQAAILLLGALAVILSACSNGDGLPGGSGMIEATEVIVSAEAAGRIENLYVDRGDKVTIGETLAAIDSTTSALQLRRADAAYSAALVKLATDSLNIDKAKLTAVLAKKEFDRVGSLITSGSVNQQQYDNAENAYLQASLAQKMAVAALRVTDAELARILAEIDILRKQLKDCRPASPLAGTVTEKYIEAGELVAPGKPLVKISRIDTVEVKIYVPPQDLTRIALGAQANIDPEDGRTEPIKGSVVWIASVAEFTPKNVQTKEARADLVYAVKISIPNADETLKVGMPVSVSIP